MKYKNTQDKNTKIGNDLKIAGLAVVPTLLSQKARSLKGDVIIRVNAYKSLLSKEGLVMLY